MVLEGPEVQRLVGLAKVGGGQSSLGTPTHETTVSTGTGVVAPEGGGEGVDPTRLADPERLVTQLKDPGAEFLDQAMSEVSVTPDGGLQDGDNEGVHVGGRVELDHGGRCVVSAPHQHPGEDCRTIGVGQHDDHDRRLEAYPVGHHHGHRFGPEALIQMTEQVDRSLYRRSEQRFTVRGLTHRTDVHASVYSI